MKRIIALLIFLQISFSFFAQENDNYVYHNLNAGKGIVDITNYQDNVPEEIIFKVPNDIKNGVFASPLNYLDELVEYLVAWTDDDYLKIKSIHDWICHNIAYDVAAYNKGEIKIVQPGVTLRYKSAVCGGYAMLFNYMARKAGFETEYVSGYTKGKSKYAIQPIGQFVRHAWNTVKINGIFYLVDTTWDAGYVNNNRFSFAYTTDFFLTDPNIFIKRHYPQAPGWLLTDSYVSIEDFRNMKME
jgi:hypothetical protein